MNRTDNLFLYMEDYDNRELSEYDWKQALMEAVERYNQDEGTKYDPEKKFFEYCSVLNELDI